MYGIIIIFRIFGFRENNLLKLQNWSPAVIFLSFVKFGRPGELCIKSMIYVFQKFNIKISLILTVVSIFAFSCCCRVFYIAAQGVRMIYFKRLATSFRYCCFYLRFLLLLLSHFYIAAQPVRVDLIEVLLGLVLCIRVWGIASPSLGARPLILTFI